MSKVWLVPAAVLLVAGAASAAETSGDTTRAVMDECSALDIPAASVDSCLERVRILEETDTSPGLASLEARLEARVAADHEPIGPTTVGSGGVEVHSYSTGASDMGRDAGSADQMNAAQTATGTPRSLQAEGPPAVPSDDEATGNGGEGGAGPDGGIPSGASAASANQPPDVTPDDEPPIADPPDSDQTPRAGEEGAPTGDPG